MKTTQSEDPRAFLAPGESIESGHPRVLSLAEKILTGSRDEAERARRLFYWVRDSIAYDIQSPFWLPEHYRATVVLDHGRGFCVQKAVVLAALARAAGIPARLVFADLRNHLMSPALRKIMGTDRFIYHCYNELWLAGRWVKAVCSFDRRLCEIHRYPAVEFDGRGDALFAPRDAAGRPFMEYLCHHGPRADVPLDEILAAWRSSYGEEMVRAWAGLHPDASHLIS